MKKKIHSDFENGKTSSESGRSQQMVIEASLTVFGGETLPTTLLQIIVEPFLPFLGNELIAISFIDSDDTFNRRL